MPNRKRQSNRPDRRIAPEGFLDEAAKEALLARIRYGGSATHKLRPGDYGFVPPVNPRPSKSPCDDLRVVLLGEATALLQSGIRCGLVSEFPDGGIPKYIWAVDEHGEAWEAKTRPEREVEYHGYRLPDNDPQREYVLKEWKQRCR